MLLWCVGKFGSFCFAFALACGWRQNKMCQMCGGKKNELKNLRVGKKKLKTKRWLSVQSGVFCCPYISKNVRSKR
jgi:hypothetical protein